MKDDCEMVKLKNEVLGAMGLVSKPHCSSKSSSYAPSTGAGKLQRSMQRQARYSGQCGSRLIQQQAATAACWQALSLPSLGTSDKEY